MATKAPGKRKEKVARGRHVAVAALAISRHFKPLVYISVNSVEGPLNNKSFFNLYHCDQLRSQGWEENVASRSDVAVGAVRSFETHFPVVVRLCFESWLLLEGFWSGRDEKVCIGFSRFFLVSQFSSLRAFLVYFFIYF